MERPGRAIRQLPDREGSRRAELERARYKWSDWGERLGRPTSDRFPRSIYQQFDSRPAVKHSITR